MFDHQPKEFGNIDKKIVWPKIIKEFEKDGIKYRIRPIDITDIDSVVEIYNQVMPYVLFSYNHDFLFQNLYHEQATLLSKWDEHAPTRRYFFGIIEEIETSKIIMAFGCRKDPYDLVIQNQAMVLLPEYRGNLFANIYIDYIDQIFEKSGADYVFGITSTQHVFAQKIVLFMGAGVSGFMPSFLRRTIKGKKYYRDHEVYVYKFYNGSEKYSVPLGDAKIYSGSLNQFKDHLENSVIKDIASVDYTSIPTQDIQDQHITWPKMIETIQVNDEEYRMRPLDQSDIKEVVQLYKKECPYFYQSSNHFLLEEDFFKNEVAHLSKWDQHSKDRLYFMGVLENSKTHEIIMAYGCRREMYDPVIQNLAVILNSKYRNLDIGKFYIQYMMNLWKECKADYIFGYMTTQNTISQKLTFDMGAKTSAILPGHTRRYIGNGKYFRDVQVYTYINLNSSENYEVNFSDIALDKKADEHIREIIQKIDS